MLYSRDFVYPPIDGTLSIPEVIDFHSKHNAELPAFAYHEDGDSKITEISFLEFGRAAHRAAHALRPNRGGNDGEVVAFIALSDTIVYQAITVGMMKAGLVPFPISPRNTPAAVVHMLKKTSCHRLVSTQTTLRTLLDGVRDELAASDPTYQLVIQEVPSLDNLYPKLGQEKAEDAFLPYPPSATRQSMKALAAYLHSSGSTGFPKPIPQTHEIFVHWAAFPSTLEFRDHTPRVRIAGMHLPPFHTLGVYVHILYVLYGCTTVGVYPPSAKAPHMLPIMPTPDNIIEHSRRTKSNSMMSIPALLQVWAQNQESVDYLGTLEFVGYSGGGVAPKLGDFMVANGVKLNPGYGGTEFGSPTYAIPRKGDEKDWAWMEFSERSNIRWVPQGDGTYECQFLVTDTHSLPVEDLKDVRGYATSDLWEKHPTKDYLWKIVGRIDDVIIHSSGEKTVPAPMEDVVMSSAYVMGTVMFGREHDQPGILIEPKASYAIDIEDTHQLADLRNKLWPVIEEANKMAPAFSRIFKEMILITSKDKPLPRTGKGTVMRKMALKAYHEEIEGLYATVESTAKGEAVDPPETWKESDVKSWLMLQTRDLNSGRAIVSSADLFEQGFDSLSATILRRRITGALLSTKDSAAKHASTVISQTTVYNYPTIDELAVYISALVENPESAGEGKTRKELIEAMISKYSSGLDEAVTIKPSKDVPEKAVVLITGSTGNLGAQLLESMLQDEKVERIYAMNRASSGSRSMLERHIERFEDKALNASLLSSQKIVFIEGEVGQENLGLSSKVYDELRDLVTVIIHTAWRLDFNLSLSSFEANVRGTRNLIDFARSGPYASSVKFLFTSSVASTFSWDQSKGAYPEEVVMDATYSIGNGYGEGKYVAERLLAQSGLQATSLRIGQISGGLPNGAWATSDWVPILVKSSLTLGSLPSMTGVASWLPMDAIANTMLDIIFSAEKAPVALNLVHPRPVEWNTIMTSVGESIAKERGLVSPLPIIPFQDWFSLLERSSKTVSEEEQKKIPAIKLLDFFRGMSSADLALAQAGRVDAETGGLTKFSTTKAQSVSKTMEQATSIDAHHAALWVKYWNTVGLFD